MIANSWTWLGHLSEQVSGWRLLTCLALALISVVTRSFFLWREQETTMPAWLHLGLRYAPVAALAAVVFPDVLLIAGEWASWRNAKLWGAVAGALWFYARRDVLGTIVCGTLVFLPLRLGLGW